MVNITNTKSCPYISPPPYISLPMYKPTKKCLRTNISPGLIFGGLRYSYIGAFIDKKNTFEDQVMPTSVGS